MFSEFEARSRFLVSGTKIIPRRVFGLNGVSAFFKRDEFLLVRQTMAEEKESENEREQKLKRKKTLLIALLVSFFRGTL